MSLYDTTTTSETKSQTRLLTSQEIKILAKARWMHSVGYCIPKFEMHHMVSDPQLVTNHVALLEEVFIQAIKLEETLSTTTYYPWMEDLNVTKLSEVCHRSEEKDCLETAENEKDPTIISQQLPQTKSSTPRLLDGSIPPHPWMRGN